MCTAVTLTVVVGLTGCVGGDVSNGGSADPTGSPVGPLVAEDVVRLDLREAPTAQEAGIGPDRRDLVLSRVGEAIDTELELPGGRLSLDAFGVSIAGGPIGEPDPAYAGRIVVNVRSGGTTEVEQLLLDQAAVLGIDPEEVRQWAAQVGTPDRRDSRFFEAPAATSGPEIFVDIRWEESGGNFTLNYSFSFSGPPGTGA